MPDLVNSIYADDLSQLDQCISFLGAMDLSEAVAPHPQVTERKSTPPEDPEDRRFGGEPCLPGASQWAEHSRQQGPKPEEGENQYADANHDGR